MRPYRKNNRMRQHYIYLSHFLVTIVRFYFPSMYISSMELVELVQYSAVSSDKKNRPISWMSYIG